MERHSQKGHEGLGDRGGMEHALTVRNGKVSTSLLRLLTPVTLQWSASCPECPWRWSVVSWSNDP